MRFDIPFDDGETKRIQYNRFGREGAVNKQTGLPLEAPELTIPDQFLKLWMVYFTISNQVSRIKDGVCFRIPPSEIVAWKELSGISVSTFEYSLLVDMDEAFCTAMNIELEERRPKPEKGKK